MVWKLSALKNAHSGAQYYIFKAPGAYKIGRKDCSVCIATDKTVSRVHAEFVVQPLPSGSTHCEAIVRDLSKFGTFVNKNNVASPKPVLKLPQKEAVVRDGDEITFGTAFRVDYVHYFFCVSASRSNSVISKATSLLGSHCVETWDPECTHVLAEDGSLVTELVLMAVAHGKPVVSLKWLESISTSPDEEIPDISSYAPTLKFPLADDANVRIVLPDYRVPIFEGIVFVATSLQKYYCKEKLESIVRAGGGTLQLISKGRSQLAKRQHVIVVPHGNQTHEEFSDLQHLQRITEKNLLIALLSGCKDNSAFYVPPCAAESQSTDATVDLQESEDDADSVADTPQARKPSSVHAVQSVEKNEREISPAEP